MTDVRTVLAAAVTQLSDAEVPSPAVDARELLALAMGVDTKALPLIETITAEQSVRFQDLIDRRAQRIPLQHLTGVAYFRYAELAVGPGVFIPRPETEVMTGWAIDQLRGLMAGIADPNRPPTVVELCAGSGAISKAIAEELPGCRQYAVELSDDAAVWAERNLAGTRVDFRVGDMATAFPELDGTVDLVIGNPPYIPLDAYASVTPEVRDHDPMVALFSGDDGLDAMRVVADVGARLLHEGGLICAEHAEVQEHSVVDVFVRHGGYARVRDHHDLGNRPRFVTAGRTVVGRPDSVWQD